MRKRKKASTAIRPSGWERLNAHGTWKPGLLGIRRCNGNRKFFVAEVLRPEGTALNTGFTQITDDSVDGLLRLAKRVWGECAFIVDLFVWQEERRFAADGI